MSISALDWAFRKEVFQPSQKLVLLALSNFCSHTGKSYPSVWTICQITSQKDETVRKALAALVEQGVIFDTGKKAGDTQQVKVYQFPKEAWELKTPQKGSLKDPPEDPPEDPPKGGAEPLTVTSREIDSAEVEPPITRKEFNRLVEFRGIDAECADWFWNNCEGTGWVDRTGRRIKKVEPLLLNSAKSWKGKRNGNETGGGLPKWRQVEALEEQIGKHTANYESKFYRKDCTELDCADLRAKRKKLQELKTVK